MNVALIPVRGGSKSIPLKNVREIAGHPLVYWTTKAANDCVDIDKVYIATDSPEIEKVVRNFQLSKVIVIGRSAYTATDTASTESAMLEFANQYIFDNIVLIQATSPLLTSDDLHAGFCKFRQEKTDSVLSAVRQKRFCWKEDEQGFAHAINYDIFHRPRRQEFDGYLVENGAFYITSREKLLKTKNRISGNIRLSEMSESTYFEIDEPSDWMVIERQLTERMKENAFGDKARNIKMFLTDCDGCLTDGGMYYSENGDELKKFNSLDGMGLSMLKKRGILIGIITGEKKVLNRRRSEKLKLDIYKEGIKNKLETIKELCLEYNISFKEVAYVGDDVNDLEVIQNVGIGCSVPNGRAEVRQAADYVTKTPGGQGAVREVADLLLQYMR